MKKYLMGGNVNLRLRLHERMSHDCFVAKEAYKKTCYELRNSNREFTEDEVFRIYEEHKKKSSFIFLNNEE